MGSVPVLTVWNGDPEKFAGASNRIRPRGRVAGRSREQSAHLTNIGRGLERQELARSPADALADGV